MGLGYIFLKTHYSMISTRLSFLRHANLYLPLWFNKNIFFIEKKKLLWKPKSCFDNQYLQNIYLWYYDSEWKPKFSSVHHLIIQDNKTYRKLTHIRSSYEHQPISVKTNSRIFNVFSEHDNYNIIFKSQKLKMEKTHHKV